MMIIILIIAFLIFDIPVLFGAGISYKNMADFKGLTIQNGTVSYVKNLGYGIGFEHRKEGPSQYVDLLLDFNDKAVPKMDVTGHYTFNEYQIFQDPDVTLNSSSVGGFTKQHHRIVIQVSNNSFLANSLDLGSFFIDMYLYPTIHKNNTVLASKGIFYDNKEYGFTITLENKKIIVRLNNLFYDEAGGSYSFTLRSEKKIEAGAWQHIGFIFNRANGKLLLYIDGALDTEEFATADGKPGSEILIPKFLKFDGSSLVLFKNYYGYVDDFRIGRTADIEFKNYINTLVDEVQILSPVMDLKYYNSEVSEVKFKIRDHAEGVIDIQFKHSNTLDGENGIIRKEWSRMSSIEIKGDTLRLKDFNPNARYLQWRLLLRRNPISSMSPLFYYF
ncbi:MAG: LamG domain-containing protein, partial [Spirochaetes bacterium]|nr:LamG domain-containing protein [Spirochaetota bacterium]